MIKTWKPLLFHTPCNQCPHHTNRCTIIENTHGFLKDIYEIYTAREGFLHTVTDVGKHCALQFIVPMDPTFLPRSDSVNTMPHIMAPPTHPLEEMFTWASVSDGSAEDLMGHLVYLQKKGLLRIVIRVWQKRQVIASVLTLRLDGQYTANMQSWGIYKVTKLVQVVEM